MPPGNGIKEGAKFQVWQSLADDGTSIIYVVLDAAGVGTSFGSVG